MYQFQDDDVICTCKGVTKKQFVSLLNEHQLHHLDAVREKTGVNVACGMCIVVVEDLLLKNRL
ncbi:MAG: (2Fe-2S)-binding protein [Cycloclasticus sp.]